MLLALAYTCRCVQGHSLEGLLLLLLIKNLEEVLRPEETKNVDFEAAWKSK
jgi:hypothetical protein